tara:strand:- start:606 stop:1631 length:1026 start_codon:yes stop_codon:yes gene_type:complete
MQNLLYLILTLTLVNLFFVKNFELIGKKYNLYDNPDEIRKKQIKPVPLLGGLLFLINIFIFFCFDYFFNSKSFFLSLGFFGKKNIIIFCLSLFFIFCIGFVDDKIKLKPFTKLVLLSIILSVIFMINEQIVINNLNFYFLENSIDLFNLGILFSILCIVTYINMLNMLDGINLISAIYYLSIASILFLYNFQIYFVLTFVIFTLFFIFLNRQGKIYLGDSGVYAISFILSLSIISLYEKNNLNVESVLLIMFVPVIDFLRLIIKRVLDRRHPFQADENHFHHIINKNYNNKKYLILILFFYSPILFDYFFNINVYIIILIMTISYALILKKNISKIKASIK